MANLGINWADVRFTKSSYSGTNGGNCVELGIAWTDVEFTKSSYSTNDGGNCVELGNAASVIGIRDSKLGEHSPVLEFTPNAFRAFLTHLKSGSLD
ncbi:DUF397 domain-containing protein [Saccharopolyspora taberi]|uniref:DUF397 domain-containing protein n=1 Tax=Saccharopolyspora taberi TaxID=60895 RepID=A0ABN3VKM2_9PSEU